MQTKQQKHFLVCSAPICSCDPNPNYKKEAIWIPGEQVCRFKPYEKFQEKQLKINRKISLGKYKVEQYFKASELEGLKIV